MMDNYDNLMTKLADSPIRLSPALQDVANRVKKAGLHKVANHFYGQPITFKSAATVLGEKLVRQELRNQKIASGLDSLKHLESEGEVILPKIASMFNLKTLQKLVPEEAAVGKAISKEVPEQIASTSSRSADDIFSKFNPSGSEIPMRKGLGKTTIRGEAPAVKPLEEYHTGLPKAPE